MIGGKEKLYSWIIDAGTSSRDPEDFVRGLASRMVAQGIPIHTLTITVPSVHPGHQAYSLIWLSDESLIAEVVEHGADADRDLESSPLSSLLRRHLKHGRWNLKDPNSAAAFPQLSKLVEDGCTDYLLRIAEFSRGTAIVGMGFSITTQRPSGFSDIEVEYVDAIMPPLGLAVYRMAMSQLASAVLGLYVGRKTSIRILNGEIRRGEGDSIYAAVLFADLKNFTGLTESFSSKEIVCWLNQYFEAVGSAVEACGGEILKLMGDSLLAIFPTEDQAGGPNVACSQALTAAQNALTAVALLNTEKGTQTAPAIDVDVVLHLGEVFYGNIGAAHRLDFTVIGQAVNEAARLETLCDELRQQLLMSSTFAQHCHVPTEKLGVFKLRGVKLPQAVFGIKA